MKIKKYTNYRTIIKLFTEKSAKSGLKKNGLLLFFWLMIIVMQFEGCKTEDDISKQLPPAHPCPGLAVVNYGGEDYPTVEIGNQCWLAKNLNIGNFIAADTEMTNNTEIEKYCYLNNPSLCLNYGGLYQWDEMMQYSNVEGSRGLCPEGWHIPTKKDFEGLLENIAEIRRLQDYRDPYWFWNQEDSAKITGFNALTGGQYWHSNHEFFGRHKIAVFWSSSESDSTFAKSFQVLGSAWEGPTFYDSNRLNATSVRCIKDQE
jgi:uncharacterized protein (TIGR02145 family)